MRLGEARKRRAESMPGEKPWWWLSPPDVLALHNRPHPLCMVRPISNVRTKVLPFVTLFNLLFLNKTLNCGSEKDNIARIPKLLGQDVSGVRWRVDRPLAWSLLLPGVYRYSCRATAAISRRAFCLWLGGKSSVDDFWEMGSANGHLKLDSDSCSDLYPSSGSKSLSPHQYNRVRTCEE